MTFSGLMVPSAPIHHWTAPTLSITLIFWHIKKYKAGAGERHQQQAKRSTISHAHP